MRALAAVTVTAVLVCAGAVLAASATSSGRALFVSNCASCHKLADAQARGTAGPNLDRLFRHVSRTKIRARVRRAILRGDGAMPAGILGRRQADIVADYVARVSRRR